MRILSEAEWNLCPLSWHECVFQRADVFGSSPRAEDPMQLHFHLSCAHVLIRCVPVSIQWHKNLDSNMLPFSPGATA